MLVPIFSRGIVSETVTGLKWPLLQLFLADKSYNLYNILKRNISSVSGVCLCTLKSLGFLHLQVIRIIRVEENFIHSCHGALM